MNGLRWEVFIARKLVKLLVIAVSKCEQSEDSHLKFKQFNRSRSLASGAVSDLNHFKLFGWCQTRSLDIAIVPNQQSSSLTSKPSFLLLVPIHQLLPSADLHLLLFDYSYKPVVTYLISSIYTLYKVKLGNVWNGLSQRGLFLA